MHPTLALAQPATPDPAPPQPSASWPPSLPVLLIAGGLLVLAALLAWASRAARAGARAPGAAPVAPRDSEARELAQLYKQAAAELDVRLERMERLLALADERTAQLQSLQSERGAHAGSGNGARTDHAPAGAPHSAPATPVPAHADDTTRQVYALADAGRSPVQIAQQLGTHTGKVQLILALRQG